jgi:hypothetical protein
MQVYHLGPWSWFVGSTRLRSAPFPDRLKQFPSVSIVIAQPGKEIDQCPYIASSLRYSGPAARRVVKVILEPVASTGCPNTHFYSLHQHSI